MTFDVSFTDNEEVDEGFRYRYVRIEAGKLDERFRVSLEHWDAKQYDAAWREAARDVVLHGRRSAIVSAPTDLDNRFLTLIYPLRREGERVRVQNWLASVPPVHPRLRFLSLGSQARVPTSLRKRPYAPHDLVPQSKRWSSNASEWDVDCESVRAFAEGAR